ncbi:hypothetical protein JTE90_005904 [Oedothorax gibbosus]|uniref:Terminase large subunit GpA endonuclease domain-containing protein n=1 Tax=Oedothorax gibbosus TaxID=931172 RepID=A0AAV6TS03_9ARAC|nr:hypothetical protein JTE90_005904 [Oedothorax gibbosus]
METFLSAVHERPQAQEIAKNLVNSYTGVGRILGREMDDLKVIEGVTDSAVAMIMCVKETLERVLREKLKEGAPGYCHFPEYPPEYFKQLTAEQLITKVVKGYTKQEWQKIRDRNEVLDCRIYARAASIALGIDRWPESKWNSLSGKMESKKSKKIVKSKWMKNV